MAIGIAQEGSTFIVTITVTDQDGDPQTPKTGVWSLLDSNKNIVNSRKEEAIVPLSSVMEVGLSGDDLPCPYNNKECLSFIFEGTYDTNINGVPAIDQPIREEETIEVENITTIP